MKLITLFIFLFSLKTYGEVIPLNSQNPDILIQTIFNKKEQKFVLNAIHSYLNKTLGYDPLSQILKEKIQVVGSLNGNKMRPELYQMISDALGFEFNQGKVSIELDGLNCDTKTTSLT